MEVLLLLVAAEPAAKNLQWTLVHCYTNGIVAKIRKVVDSSATHVSHVISRKKTFTV